MGCWKLFSDQPEPVTRELRAYIGDLGESLIKNKYQRTRTRFLDKYGRLFLYDIYFEKIYSIDDEDIHFVKLEGCALIGDPDNPDGTSTYHEYFFIHDDFFYRILETDQNSDIELKVIHKYVSSLSINDNSTGSSSKFSNSYETVLTHHQL